MLYTHKCGNSASNEIVCGSYSDPKMPKLSLMVTERDMTLKSCSTPINAAIPLQYFNKSGLGFLSRSDPKWQNWAQWVAKMAFLSNDLGTERDTTLKPWWFWALYFIWKPGYSHFWIWAQKRGFPKVNFGGLFWGFLWPMNYRNSSQTLYAI